MESMTEHILPMESMTDMEGGGIAKQVTKEVVATTSLGAILMNFSALEKG